MTSSIFLTFSRAGSCGRLDTHGLQRALWKCRGRYFNLQIKSQLASETNLRIMFHDSPREFAQDESDEDVVDTNGKSWGTWNQQEKDWRNWKEPRASSASWDNSWKSWDEWDGDWDKHEKHNKQVVAKDWWDDGWQKDQKNWKQNDWEQENKVNKFNNQQNQQNEWEAEWNQWEWKDGGWDGWEQQNVKEEWNWQNEKTEQWDEEEDWDPDACEDQAQGCAGQTLWPMLFLWFCYVLPCFALVF